MIEDKIFCLMFTNAATGELLVDFDGGRNAWRSMTEMQNETKKYKSFDAEMTSGLTSVPITETMYRYGGDEF